MMIPPNIAKWMSPEDRAKYVDEPIGSERQEQAKFADWLKQQWEEGRLEYFWQRTDKKATGKPGTPDFIVALPGGKTLWIEFKPLDRGLSIPQAATIKNLDRLNHLTFVAHSKSSAIRFVEQILANSNL